MKNFILILLFLLPALLLNAQSHYASIVVELTAEAEQLSEENLKDVIIILKHKDFEGGEMILTSENTKMEFGLPSAGSKEISSAQILLSLKLPYEGEYTYEVDASHIDGESDDLMYQGHFRLGQGQNVEKQETAVSNFSSYPNPFSTETRFSFTLEGDELPDDVILQIFTQSGNIVQELTSSELGSLQLGENRPNFAWDGTDRSGNILPNGIYFYRMMVIKDGKTTQSKDQIGKTIIAR